MKGEGVMKGERRRKKAKVKVEVDCQSLPHFTLHFFLLPSSFFLLTSVPHRLLILSRHASDYHRLVDDARLPDLQVRSSSDIEHIADAGACDLAFGEPLLLPLGLSELTALH